MNTSPDETIGARRDRRWSRLIRCATIGILISAAALRLAAAIFDQGIVWPDEIYQSLEQAHRLAFGPGLIPWEFRAGVRSWLLPGMLAGVLRTAALLGAHTGIALVSVAKGTMAAASAGTVALSMRLAHRVGGAKASLIAAALVGFHPMLLLFAARALGEVASTPLVVAAVDFAVIALMGNDARGRDRAAAYGGLCAGAATIFRFQVGVILLALLATLATRHRERAARCAVGAAIPLILGGVLDAFTWGAPFHSVLTYLGVMSDPSASIFGALPPSMYGKVLLATTGIVSIVVLVGLIAGAKKGVVPLAVSAVFVVVHVAIGHKEARYLLPAIPLLLVVAAIGLASLCERLAASHALATGISAAMAAAFVVQATRLRFTDIGIYYGPTNLQSSPWHSHEAHQRLLSRIGERPDVCGVTVAGLKRPWSGGFTYLHRSVPLLWGFDPDVQAAANVLLAPTAAGSPPGFVQVDRLGKWAISVRAGGCQPPPSGWEILERW